MTEAEIIEAIRAAMASGPSSEDGAFTVTELHLATGWHRDRIRTVVRSLISDGRVVATYCYRMDMSGRKSYIPAYRFVG